MSSVDDKNCYPINVHSTIYVDKKVTDCAYNYHDDLYGYFFARGQRFGLGTLHLPDFQCYTVGNDARQNWYIDSAK